MEKEIVQCKDCIHFAKAVYFDDNDQKQYYPYGMCGNTGKSTVVARLNNEACGHGIRRNSNENL